MKRFLIEISRKDSPASTLEDREVILRSEYFYIIRRLRDIGLYNDILKDIPLICDRCKSFILPVRTLNHIIESLPDYDWGFHEIENKIMGVVRLTLEEWVKYVTEGIKGVNFVYSINGEPVMDTEGNPYKYLWEECAVIFNPECGCNSVMRGY